VDQRNGSRGCHRRSAPGGEHSCARSCPLVRGGPAHPGSGVTRRVVLVRPPAWVHPRAGAGSTRATREHVVLNYTARQRLGQPCSGVTVAPPRPRGCERLRDFLAEGAGAGAGESAVSGFIVQTAAWTSRIKTPSSVNSM